MIKRGDLESKRAQDAWSTHTINKRLAGKGDPDEREAGAIDPIEKLLPAVPANEKLHCYFVKESLA